MRGALNDVLGGGAASVLTVSFRLVLLAVDLRRSAFALSFLWIGCDLHRLGRARHDAGARQFSAICDCGSRQFNRGGIGDPDLVAGRANDGGRSFDAAAGAGSDHARPLDHRDRNRPLRFRHLPHGPRHPLRALSRGRRLSRRHRPVDRARRDPRHHRTSGAIHGAGSIRQSDHPVGAGRGLRDGAGAVFDLAPVAHDIRLADHPGRRRDRGASRLLARGHFARRGPGRGLDLSAAAVDHLHAAMASGRARSLSLAPAAGSLGRPDRGHLRDRDQHAVQYRRDRGGGATRGQSRAGAERHRACQYHGRRARRLCRLHLGQPLDPQLQLRRPSAG